MLTLKTLALSLWISVAGFFGYVQPEATIQTPVENQSVQTFGATSQQPTDIALFSTTLVSGIQPTDTSMTLANGFYNNGVTPLASSTYMFVIGGTELVLADCTGTVCTNMTRGIDWSTGTSTVSALRGTWRRGDSVKITTASMVIYSNIFNGKQNISSLLKYNTAPTFTYGNRELVTYDRAKDYADSVALAGAPNSDETTKGVVESGTAIEQASSTLVGATAARTVLQTRYSSSSPLVGCNGSATAGALCVPVAQNDGKISPNYIATSSVNQYNWGASTTFSATTSIIASGTSTFPLKLNGVPYSFPSTQGASSTVWVNDGTGQMTNNTLDWQLIYASTTSGTAATTTFSVASRNNYRLIVSSAQSLTFYHPASLQFNSDTANNYSGAIGINGGTHVTTVTENVIQMSQGESGNTNLFLSADIFDISGMQKMIQFRSSAYSTSYSNAWDGAGTWTGTSQITSMSFGIAGGIPSGTIIRVYASRD